jgi:hypothetical protein
MKETNRSAKLSGAKVGAKIVRLGGKILTTSIDNVSSSCRVDAYSFCVTLGTAIDMFLKDADKYASNPNVETFVDMKISAFVLTKHLRSEKFAKVGVK